MIELLAPWEEAALEMGREGGWQSAVIAALEARFGAIPNELSQKAKAWVQKKIFSEFCNRLAQPRI